MSGIIALMKHFSQESDDEMEFISLTKNELSVAVSKCLSNEETGIIVIDIDKLWHKLNFYTEYEESDR